MPKPKDYDQDHEEECAAAWRKLLTPIGQEEKDMIFCCECKQQIMEPSYGCDCRDLT